MPDFLHALQTGSSNLWVFIPAAILLGSLHGLEPGHSKTMMAAFIIAIRGTIFQAVLLGVSAAISHSLIIVGLAIVALEMGSKWNAERIEPYLQIGSAVCILGLALWMFLRTRREVRAAQHHQHHHYHGHHHPEHGAPLHDHAGHHHHHEETRNDYQDAHELEHAEDIRKRFAEREVTTPQLVLFGVTGGLMPCPAAFTVMLVCLQLKRIALGAAMVGAFSFGLALTMVATGSLAAISVRHAERRFKGFGEIVRRAPYISCVLLLILAAYIGVQGWRSL